MADEPPPLQVNEFHVPVLLAEMRALLDPKPGGSILDATVGGGGHSASLIAGISPGGTLVGLDRDPEALMVAAKRLEADLGSRVILVHTTFGSMHSALLTLESAETIRFDGALFDFGVSSYQLDAARGFSFRRDEPLDMRMDATDSSSPTAADILGSATETEIARILWELGEEKWSRRIAQRIVEHRNAGTRMETTLQLATLIEQSIPRAAWPREIHVATRCFQGLRIAVNAELEQIRSGLNAAFMRLKPGGKLVAISYHSLEDRIVKQMFAVWAGRTPSPPGSSPAALMPSEKTEAIGTLITRKPIAPTDREMARNPRSRSAKLRALQRNF